MAQQTPFNVNSPDDDRRREARPETTNPGRYSESRSANFVGGSVDPESGNITSQRPLQVERGETSPDTGEGSRTSLGRVEAPPAPRMMSPPPPPPPPSGGNNIFGTLLQVAAVGALFFCYVAGTRIAMRDGGWKRVEDLRIGDDVELGGKVLARGEAVSPEIYRYRDQMVSGTHAVFEDGRFVRVKDSPKARLSSSPPVIVYPVVTEKHLLLLEDHIAADFSETDEEDVSPSQRLETMNADHARNEWLALIARDRGFDQD